MQQDVDLADGKLDRSALAWAMYEAGRNPYVLLCTIYIFAPYVATTVFPDPVEGQATIASWHTMAGLTVTLTAPFVGAIADRVGNRKPALLAVTAMMVFAIFSLWWALPAGQSGGLPLWLLGVLTAGLGVLFSWTEVLHNSMLTTAATPSTVPKASGLALALGNGISVAFLVFVLWGLAFPGVVDWGFVPKEPLFGLQRESYETSRIVAPISAVWFAFAAIALFLWSRDAPPTGKKPTQAAGEGVVGLFKAIGRLFRTDRNAGLFLIARMLYVDGKIAILIFSGLVAAGVFKWDLLEMSAYGIILSIFAVFGGLWAGKIDSQIGSRNAIILEIGLTLLCLWVMTSQTTTSIFGIPVEANKAVWQAPMFQTLPELVYLAGAILIAISITGAFASSRTLLARLAPKGMEGEFFGLFALAGSATAWMAPMMVEAATRMFQSQQAGLASTGILLLAGLLLMFLVKQPARLANGRY